ncbi:hypothetical protein AB6A40_010601 [Gnathostoma spinigerum]|uniref:Uncharacterized protein n=1 Tax=Gnathostoma spinigerum TaxID=75299 RepID=A0ABD6EXS1_9BILA
MNLGEFDDKYYLKATKRNAGSVRLIRDEEQEDKLLPDVYFKETLSEPPKGENDKENGRPLTATEKRARFQRVRLDSHHKPRFEPVLEPVMEILVEANA